MRMNLGPSICFVMLILGCGQNQVPPLERASPSVRPVAVSAIDMASLFGLKVFKNGPYIPKNNFVLVIYFSDLSCASCVQRELKVLCDTMDLYIDVMDYLIIAWTENTAYLRNLKRINRIEFPILVEHYPNEMKISEEMSVNLLDVSTGEFIIRFSPNPNPNTSHEIYDFLSKVKHHIESK